MVSLLPLLLSAAYFGELDRPLGRPFDQSFREGPQWLSSYYYQPLTMRERDILNFVNDLYRPSGLEKELSMVHMDKEKFWVVVDMQQFKPEEVEVKLQDNYVVVEGKHEEKQDEHGLVSRQFVRRFRVPDNVDTENISSEFSSDGVLTIQAPVKEAANKNVRKINVVQTGKPALKQKPKEQENEATGGTTTATEQPSQESTTPQK